jgi:hypothetical protein
LFIIVFLGIANEDQLLSIYVKKLFTNLQYSTITEKLIERTVNCFNDLCYGYQSVRKLVQLEPIQYFISHHTQDLFPFLSSTSILNSSNRHDNVQCSWLRLRTTFYAIIGRMLMYEFRYGDDDDDDDERIEAFMLPFTNQCQKLLHLFDELSNVLVSKTVSSTTGTSFK